MKKEYRVTDVCRFTNRAHSTIELTLSNDEEQTIQLEFFIQTKNTETHAFCSDNIEIYRKAVKAFMVEFIREKKFLIKK